MSLYQIAGLTVSMAPKHPLTISRAEPYRVESGTSAFAVTGEGNESEEYAHLARSFYEQLLSFDGFLLHASAVELDGKAIAFSAPSGTGKSTHAAFWRTELGAGIINDDKPAVRLMDGVFCVCGTPFSGKAALSRNVCVPLHAVVFLKRSDRVTVRRLSAQEALFALLDQTLRPTDAPAYDRLLALLGRLLVRIPVYEACVPNESASAAEVRNAIML